MVRAAAAAAHAPLSSRRYLSEEHFRFVRRLFDLRTVSACYTLTRCRPGVLETVPELHTIIMRHHRLESLKNVASLQALRVLDVSNGGLAELPHELAACALLERLAFADNRVAALPEALCSCRALRAIEAARNLITSIPKQHSVARLVALEVLDLRDNPLPIAPPPLALLGLPDSCLLRSDFGDLDAVREHHNERARGTLSSSERRGPEEDKCNKPIVAIISVSVTDRPRAVPEEAAVV